MTEFIQSIQTIPQACIAGLIILAIGFSICAFVYFLTHLP